MSLVRFTVLLYFIIFWNRNEFAEGMKSPICITALCAGKTYEVQVDPKDTIGDICSAVCKRNNLIPARQSVFLQGKELNKWKSIAQAGILEGDSLNIEATLVSGPSHKKNTTKRNVLKASEDIDKDIQRQKNKFLKGRGITKNDDWDVSKLRDLLAAGDQEIDNGFLKSAMMSLKNIPMDIMANMMESSSLQDLLNDDGALESMRLFMQKNLKQYETIFPGISTQAKLMTSSPALFKNFVKMANLQLKMLKGTTTTSGVSSSIFKNRKTGKSLPEKITFNDDNHDNKSS